jgi:hypothetical protein
MAGANFTLESAKRIAAAVKRMEATPRDLTGDRNPGRAIGTSFWAMITGAGDIGGKFHDWVAVQPSKSMATAQNPSTLAPSNMWEFQEPYVAGFANAREANDNPDVPAGSVVLLTFVGYAIAPTTDVGVVQGTITTKGGSTAASAGADGSIPMYAFQFAGQQQQSSLPIHDHRDNFNGGFAFSVYHPGTALPQQPWAV